MARNQSSPLESILAISLLSFFLILFYPALGEKIAFEDAPQSNLETYIVHVSSQAAASFAKSNDVMSYYHSFLPTTITGEHASSRLVHTYHNVATGFAAKLSPEEVQELEKKDGFIRAKADKKIPLHTTHSPSFLGLIQNVGVWNSSNYGEGVIIGIVDSGITPSHPSFDDKDMPPPPAKWKGKCEFSGDACNNKLIGARNLDSYIPGQPADTIGHGTHTSSTAAGSFVPGANVFGMANGKAIGIAPRAHVAMYRVCSDSGCSMADILAAMDAAVEDGVDVLSLSIGLGSQDFYDDVMAIGAFGATQKGVFVSCSAGNGGPGNSTLTNEAPWILTVGASTIDRKIKATAVLGNKQVYDGESLFQPNDFQSTKYYPLVDAGGYRNKTAAFCGPGSLDSLQVKGKVVLCTRGGSISRTAKGKTVKDAGGIAMILANDQPNGYSTLANAHVLPATQVSYYAGQQIRAYINTTARPVATIKFSGTYIGDQMAPEVTSFSSRGPSLASPGILKPDIIGPGVSILAASPVSVDNYTNQVAPFNVLSGTSMSCPHLAGIAALVKSEHPDWSPAAIKSAIMTSASQVNLAHQAILDERNLPADIFAIGAGHVNPSGAVDPGLVYDLQPEDYIPYLCGLGYTRKQIELIVRRAVNCSNIKAIHEAELNYPSFAVELHGTKKVKLTRTVTNVGEANSVYDASFERIPGVDVTVTPKSLRFRKVNQKITYKVSFIRTSHVPANVTTYVQGALIWISKKHNVRTPISVRVA